MAIVVPAPAQSGNVLSDYEYECRNLLHDATGRLYDSTRLTFCINKARDRVARDTCSVRVMQSNAVYGTQLDVAQETVNIYTGLPLGPATVDMLGVTIYSGSMRVNLTYKVFAEFQGAYRPYTQFQGMPVVWSKYGQNIVYVAPIPQQVYAVDYDTACTVNRMFDDTTPEQIPMPYQNAVAWYACYLLKQYQQAFSEAANFEAQYLRQLSNCGITAQRRTFGTAYPSS